MPAAPIISVIVIGYKMPKQLLNTVYTLSAGFQSSIDASYFEIVVVENESDENVDEQQLVALGSNIRFYRRKEPSPSPATSVNFAFSKCRGDLIGLIIDGARMVTPGTLSQAWSAFRSYPNAVTVVPGYHIGSVEQHTIKNARAAYLAEAELLDSVNWREDGYELFTISTFSGANLRGYLQPIMECNCIFSSRTNFSRIGHADTAFSLPGGGAINLHIYRSLAMLPDSTLIVLPGEGSFHQFHGGVSTSTYEGRDAQLQAIKNQLDSFWSPQGFRAVSREPILFGSVSPQAQPFLNESRQYAQQRSRRLRKAGAPLWADDDSIRELSTPKN